MAEITKFITEITALLVALTALIGAGKALFDRSKANKGESQEKRREQMVSDGISSGHLVHAGDAAKGKGFVALDSPEADVVFKVSTAKLAIRLAIAVGIALVSLYIAGSIDETTATGEIIVILTSVVAIVTMVGSFVLLVRLIYRGFWVLFLR
ncbi:MAG: hypothetical protein AAGF71_14990 [Pseudomonadota bacterium]